MSSKPRGIGPELGEDEFLRWGSWFDDKYRVSLDNRWPTFRVALNLLYQMPSHKILETGCCRMPDDWGSGMSTVLFGSFLLMYGGKLTTIDISRENMAACMEITSPYSKHIDYVTGDSIKELRGMVQSGVSSFDLIYLDSYDCPVVGDASLAQDHALVELEYAMQMAHDGTIILLDDTGGFENGGKGRLTIRLLDKLGWTCLMSHQQALFIRR